MSELAKRVLSALVLAPLALFAAWTGGLVAALLVALLSVLVAIEWMRMTGCTKTPLLAAGAALVFAYVILIALVLDGAQSVLIGAGIAALAVLLAVIAAPGRWWVAGIFYAGALGGALVLILGKAAPGFEAIVLIFLIVWMTDIAAYFGGRAMGGPRLWPAVSPKKTWSGALSGALAAIIVSALFAVFTGRSVLALAGIALLLTVASQAGDLFESSVKRRFAVKDSGSLIPGHGGFMDRVDGLVFAAVVGVLVGGAHRGFDQVAAGLLDW